MNTSTSVRWRHYRPYVVALSIFALFVGILIVLIYVPGQKSRVDQQRWDEANVAAGALNGYISQHSQIPVKLTATGYKPGPQHTALTFHKDSDAKYTFCVTYLRAGVANRGQSDNAFDAAIDSISGAVPGSDPGASDYTDSSYLYIPSNHKAGRQCQTITPPEVKAAVQPLSQAANGHTVVCGVEVNYYDAYGPILKLSTSNISTDNAAKSQKQTIVTVNSSHIPGDAGGMAFGISDGSIIFDNQCQRLSASSLKVGDTVGVYDIVSPDKPAVSIFLKQ